MYSTALLFLHLTSVSRGATGDPPLQGQVVVRSGATILVAGVPVAPTSDGAGWAARVVEDDGGKLVVEVGADAACVAGLDVRGPIDRVRARVARTDLVPMLGEALIGEGPEGSWRLAAGVPLLRVEPSRFWTLVPTRSGLVELGMLRAPPAVAWSVPWEPAPSFSSFDDFTGRELSGSWLGLVFDGALSSARSACLEVRRDGPGGGTGGVTSPVLCDVSEASSLRPVAGQVFIGSTLRDVLGWTAPRAVMWPDGSPAGVTGWPASAFEVRDGRLCADVRLHDVGGLDVCAGPEGLTAGGVEALLPEDHGLTATQAALDGLAACLVPARQRAGGLPEMTVAWPQRGRLREVSDPMVRSCLEALPRLRRGGGVVRVSQGAWPTR